MLSIFIACFDTLKTSGLFHLFFFHLTLSVPEKLKNSIFEMPIITQTLNMNDLRTTSAKSNNLHTIRKLIEYSLKTVLVKAMFTLTVFEILLSEGQYYHLPSGPQGAEGLKKIFFSLVVGQKKSLPFEKKDISQMTKSFLARKVFMIL